MACRACFKFAAALQHAQAGSAPVLIRIETRAGHGAGKPTGLLPGIEPFSFPTS
jgi:prolyl oligopeptidase PreP (S9A serine peptidase family)